MDPQKLNEVSIRVPSLIALHLHVCEVLLLSAVPFPGSLRSLNMTSLWTGIGSIWILWVA